MLSNDEFRAFRLQADTLNFNEFFRWVCVQRFDSTTKLLELAGGKAKQRSKWSHFIFVCGVVGHRNSTGAGDGADASNVTDWEIDPGAPNR